VQQRFDLEAVAHQLINPFKIATGDHILFHKIANFTVFLMVSAMLQIVFST